MHPHIETPTSASTESLCPVCLQRIPAVRIAEGDNVYLDKNCPAHGHFRTIIWRGPPSYQSWTGPAKRPSPPGLRSTPVSKGCPFDCGLCTDHRQHSCCVVLEVTQRCNLSCSVCFAESRTQAVDPEMRTIEIWFKLLLSTGGPFNIQLSGGEPTLRDDLPEIITLGRSLGFSFFQLNTNGLRLAHDMNYVRRLKEAGLGCVFLQFDGTEDAIYRTIRGAALLEVKTKAISNCAEQRLGVVLVPTLVPGVNTEDLGRIIDYALARMPTVRGVHFQPISYFGRYPNQPRDCDRITIPEVINQIERQTGGRISVADFRPPAAENAYCSFHGNFVVTSDGRLKPAVDANESGCCGPKQQEATALVTLGGGKGCCESATAGAAAKKAQQYVALRWTLPGSNAGGRSTEYADTMRLDSLDAFLEQSRERSFCVSGMAFQDAWNIDLERLQDCFVHVVGMDERIVPFCAYNITDVRCNSLYRRK
jgi:7,8-dihydro-6-hydroxymethylpterin dimethyltransferase